jgi:hypothetical protein
MDTDEVRSEIKPMPVESGGHKILDAVPARIPKSESLASPCFAMSALWMRHAVGLRKICAAITMRFVSV